MNALYSLALKIGLPKAARHIVAWLGGFLAAHGMSGVDANSPADAALGLMMIGAAAIWSAIVQWSEKNPGGWMGKITRAFDSEDFADFWRQLKPFVMDALGALAVKGVQAMSGALMAEGATTESLITSAGTWLSSQMRNTQKKPAALPKGR